MNRKDTVLLKKILRYCIECEEACGIRDVFAHQYMNLDFDIAWDAIQGDLPVLKKTVEEILCKE